MCDTCGWSGFIAQADDLLNDIEEIPKAGKEFQRGVRQRVQNMKRWAEENGHVTSKMEDALLNIRQGVEKWLR